MQNKTESRMFISYNGVGEETIEKKLVKKVRRRYKLQCKKEGDIPVLLQSYSRGEEERESEK